MNRKWYYLDSKTNAYFDMKVDDIYSLRCIIIAYNKKLLSGELEQVSFHDILSEILTKNAMKDYTNMPGIDTGFWDCYMLIDVSWNIVYHRQKDEECVVLKFKNFKN